MAIRDWISRANRFESLWSLWNLLRSAVFAAGGAVMAWLSSLNEFVASQGIFGYAVVGLLSTVLLALVFFLAALGRAHLRGEKPIAAPAGEGGLEAINRGQFENETVLIDGKNFVQCTFRNCLIKYNGGKYKMDHCRFVESIAIHSDHSMVGAGMDLVLSLTNPESKKTVDGRGRLRRDLVIKIPKDPTGQVSDSPQPSDTEPEKPQ